jgi:hypothetical protein
MFPQVPQFTSSTSRLTQLFPHRVCPTWQAQLPPTQTSSTAQILPQPPQLLTSVFGSTQAPLGGQGSWVPGQKQLPSKQDWPGGQR